MGWFLLIGALAVTFVVYCCLIVGSLSLIHISEPTRPY